MEKKSRIFILYLYPNQNELPFLLDFTHSPAKFYQTYRVDLIKLAHQIHNFEISCGW